MTQLENISLMPFVVLHETVGNRDATTQLIRKHVAYLRELDREGRLVLSGPFIDHTGGLLIIRARNKREALALTRRDPFVRSGVRHADVRSLLVSSEKNNHL